jgi:hypothetical protein
MILSRKPFNSESLISHYRRLEQTVAAANHENRYKMARTEGAPGVALTPGCFFVKFRFTTPQQDVLPQTIQSTAFIYHLTSSNGCGNLSPGSVNVSPLATLLPPEPNVYPQSFDFSPRSRNVNHAVSYSCRLFFSLHALSPARVVCFQYLADSFYKTGGWGISATAPSTRRLFTQSLEGGVVQRTGGSTPNLHNFGAPINTFRMNTCKSVSKQRTLTSSRMNTCEKPGGGGAVGRAFDFQLWTVN